MKMFDDNFRFTQDAIDFDHEIENAITPIMKKYLKHGASPRELSHIAQSAVSMVELVHIVDKETT